ncbi:hypothetical protein BGZ70_005507, partial [Mortierella alpina]
MTDEYRSSKNCVYCHFPIRLARSRRLVEGKIKTVYVNGAVECINPDCESVTCGYTTKSRDPHAAVGIAIAGSSPHFDANRAILPPYSRMVFSIDNDFDLALSVSYFEEQENIIVYELVAPNIDDNFDVA